MDNIELPITFLYTKLTSNLFSDVLLQDKVFTLQGFCLISSYIKFIKIVRHNLPFSLRNKNTVVIKGNEGSKKCDYKSRYQTQWRKMMVFVSLKVNLSINEREMISWETKSRGFTMFLSISNGGLTNTGREVQSKN